MFRTNRTLFILLLMILAILAACSNTKDAANEPTVEFKVQVAPTDTPAPTPAQLKTEIIEAILPLSPLSPIITSTDIMTNSSAQPMPGSEEPLAAAIKDLVEQTGVSPNEINVISLEAVEWSDASLGCPQEGFMYAQVITPGFKIILEAQGQQYEYHTDRKSNVVLCQQ
jgi:hypothetical protein